MEADKNNVKELARGNQEETNVFFTKLKRKKPKNLDTVTHRIHDSVCAKFDCLQCGNCCSSISPMIGDKDIDRILSELAKIITFYGITRAADSAVANELEYSAVNDGQ